MNTNQSAGFFVNGRKRKRVTRACDGCRHNKIKCNGQQPCLVCTSHELECTYDKPSTRTRTFSAPLSETIENRLQKIESILKDLVEPGSECKSIRCKQQGRKGASVSEEEDETVSPAGSSRLEISLDASGKLDVDDYGHHNFHGHSSGIAFLAQIRQKYGDLLGPEGDSRTTATTGPDLRQIFDPGRSFQNPGAQIRPGLPPRKLANDLVGVALENVCALSRVVHRPSFETMLDRVYSIESAKHGLEEVRFRPLLYAVMAVGSFASTLEDNDYKCAMSTAIELFVAAKEMTDITDCRDLTSLQTLIFMIIFLQCSSRMSACYIYLGVAIKSAVRMGLHRRVAPSVSPIERETRSRVFWVLRKMDIYVSTMLGLPSTIADEDIDQDIPIDMNDEYIRRDDIPAQSHRRFTQMTATVAHVRLMDILKRVTRHVYPIKGMEQQVRGRNKVYFVSYSKVREIEVSLREWLGNLPESLKVPTNVTERFTSCLLRTSYYHVRLLLYRPFVRYLPSGGREKPFVDKEHAAAGAACLNAAKHIVRITREMKHGFLNGGHWFALYATFFAVFSLLYFVLESPSDDRAPTAFEDAKQGRELLASLSDRSPIAERCTVSLKILFDRLPETLAKRLGEACVPNSSSTNSSPENPSDVFSGFNSFPTNREQTDSETPIIAATLTVNSRFAWPTPSKQNLPSVGRKNEPTSPSSAFSTTESLSAVGTQLPSQELRGFPSCNAERAQLTNADASMSPATGSLASSYPRAAIPGLSPFFHQHDGATVASEAEAHPANLQNHYGLQHSSGASNLYSTSAQNVNEEQAKIGAVASSSNSRSLETSWSTNDDVDEFLQVYGGADINLGYFFDENEEGAYVD